ncbi:sodium-dependent transporter [Thermococcus sp.]
MEMRKISILMALLITGYILGVWNFLLVPKYLIVFGLKGMAIVLVSMFLALLLMLGEFEATRDTRYLIHEFMVKVARFPAVTLVLLMFLLVLGGVTLYYTSLVFVPVFSLSTPALLAVVAVEVLLILVLLVILKGHTVAFIGALSVLLVLFTPAATLLMRSKVHSFVTSPKALSYLSHYRHAIFSSGQPLTLESTVFMIVVTLLGLGLGAGVYYVLGTFAPKDLDFRKVLVAVVILQVILSFSAAMSTVYSIGAAYQSYENAQVKYNQIHEELGKVFTNPNYTAQQAIEKSKELMQQLKEVNRTLTNFKKVEVYAKNGNENPIKAVETFYQIPNILKESRLPGASAIVALLMSSLFLAGITTVIVLVEIGAQITGEVMQVGRGGSVSFISLVIGILGGLMAYPGFRVMLLAVPLSIGALVAAVEAFPLVRFPKEWNRELAASIGVFFIIVGFGAMRYVFAAGGSYARLGVVIGILVFIPLLFNRYLVGPAGRRG